MQADPRAQRILLDVAQLDQAAAKINHTKRTLPVLAQLQQSASERAAVMEKVVAADTRLGDAKLELSRIESDLEPAQERLKRNQEKLDSGAVVAKALTSLADEVEHLRGRISTLEDSQLDAMENVENLTEVRDRLLASQKTIEDGMREMIKKRDAEGAKLDAQLKENRDERAQLAKDVQADVLAVYDRVAAKSGTGAARLQGNRCSGCGLELDAAELDRHRKAGVADVMRCPECSRILVRVDETPIANGMRG